MNTEERQALLALAAELFRNGRAGEVIDQLSDPDSLEVWRDQAFVTAVLAEHGSALATSRLAELTALGPGTDARLVLPVGRHGAIRRTSDGLVVHGVVLAGPLGAVDELIAWDCAGAVIGFQIDDAVVEPAPGLDPSLDALLVHGPVRRWSECHEPEHRLIPARALRALAGELLGVARGARLFATDHVRHRDLFGQPLGSFQTVRHRLVDAYTAELAALGLLEVGAVDAPWERQCLIKAWSGRAALTSVQVAQQVCGAMGFTEEYGLGDFVRRAYFVDGLGPSSESLPEWLGRQILEHGLPPESYPVPGLSEGRPESQGDLSWTT